MHSLKLRVVAEQTYHDAGEPSLLLELDGDPGSVGIRSIRKSLPGSFIPLFERGKFGCD